MALFYIKQYSVVNFDRNARDTLLLSRLFILYISSIVKYLGNLGNTLKIILRFWELHYLHYYFKINSRLYHAEENYYST